MSLYIQQLAKLISNQLGRLYRHFGANSDGAAWFLICTSLISQQYHWVGSVQFITIKVDARSSDCQEQIYYSILDCNKEGSIIDP